LLPYAKAQGQPSTRGSTHLLLSRFGFKEAILKGLGALSRPNTLLSIVHFLLEMGTVLPSPVYAVVRNGIIHAASISEALTQSGAPGWCPGNRCWAIALAPVEEAIPNEYQSLGFLLLQPSRHLESSPWVAFSFYQ
jgi:hypothetical protein